ncbi:MAG: adenylate/guanylate cyclase domain-containing protein [Chloroflexota bacterium]
MTKKSSPVNGPINKNKNVARWGGGKTSEPLDNTSPRLHADENFLLKEQLAQRESELDVINSIQQGLAAKLGFQAIVDLVGDGLMAIFGAPIHRDDHRKGAVLAALEMMSLLEGFNQEQALQNKTQSNIGIGIASGRMIAGYTGTQHRATYTCVGDTVNLASRIENHTRIAHRPILIDQYTSEGLSNDIEIESLGSMVFKGKQQPINIFAVK